MNPSRAIAIQLRKAKLMIDEGLTYLEKADDIEVGFKKNIKRRIEGSSEIQPLIESFLASIDSAYSIDIQKLLGEIEHGILIKYRNYHTHKVHAAKALKLNRTTFVEKCRKYGV